MLKYYNYDIVFQEIPDEVTVAINITNCPNRCPGCHSAFLQEDIGEEITEEVIGGIVSKYGAAITCFSFMGGDCDPFGVADLARLVKRICPQYKRAWYSGCDYLPEGFDVTLFDFIKIGRYDAACGGLKSTTTNQRLYRIEEGGEMVCINDLLLNRTL